MIQAAAEMSPEIPVRLHQDHGNGPATCRSAIRNGFISVMMDGARAEDARTPAEPGDDRDVTAKVAKLARAVGVSVEGELGCLGSLATGRGEAEDGHGAGGALSKEQLLTDPDQAPDFVTGTKVDALPMAIGTRHGACKPSREPTCDVLAMHAIRAIHARRRATHLETHGSRMVQQDLRDILDAHGGQRPKARGVAIAGIRGGLRSEVRKIEIDTDWRIAMTGQVRKVAAEELGTAGRAARIKPVPKAEMASRYATGALDPARGDVAGAA
jgi:fructose-bisphosphate aldolase class II